MERVGPRRVWSSSSSWCELELPQKLGRMYGQVHPELDLHGGAELKIGGALGVKYTF